MRLESITEIPKECGFCDKPPIKLVHIKVRRFFGKDFEYDAFVCKEHIEIALATPYRESS